MLWRIQNSERSNGIAIAVTAQAARRRVTVGQAAWRRAMLFNRQLTHEGHIHRLVITSDINGWNIREEADTAVVRQIHREDWHRVERDCLLFDIAALDLKRDGWTEVPGVEDEAECVSDSMCCNRFMCQ
jgi:hypothetical protein